MVTEIAANFMNIKKYCMKKTASLAFVAAACLAMFVVPSTVFGRGPGTSAGNILKIDTGARPVALGGSYCGISDDINAAQYNPAGLGQIQRQEIMVTHNEWFQEIRSEFLGYGIPLNEYWSLGIALNYMYVNGLTEWDETGNIKGGKFGAYNGLATITAGTEISEDMYFGVSLKALQESVDNKSSLAYAGDAGLLCKMDDFRVGLAVQNAGTKVKIGEDGFDMPMNIRGGVSYAMLENSLLVACDVNKPLDNKLEIRGGVEWWLAEPFALRAGYRTNINKNEGLGISAGFGLKLSDYLIDYSFLPYGDIGNTHRLSLSYKFGEGK